jgi:catechol 2,3-dioxygenase-like lactoylglutathione lyase family enzyme
VIGLHVLATIETADVREVIVGAEQIGTQLMLAEHTNQSRHINPSGIWKVFVNTEDLDGILSRAKDAGAQVVDGPIFLERFGLQLVFVKDPDGYLIEIGQRADTASSASS